MINSIKTTYRINVDKRGKITTGIKKTNSQGVEYPSTTDYFVIDEFPELKAIYGEKPKKLMLVFPQNEIASFLQIDKVLYGSNNAMIRKCDEIECIHRIDEELDHVGIIDADGSLQEAEPYKKKYVAGEISECCCKTMPSTVMKNGKEVKNPKLCNCAMYMKAHIVDYKVKKIVSPTCYLFYSGSINTAANIYSELDKIKTITNGRLANIPFGLTIDMVGGRDDAKRKYPIWNIQVLGTMDQLEKATNSFLYGYRDMLQIGEGENDQQEDQKVIEPHKENITEPTIDKQIEQENDPNYWVSEIQKLPLVTKKIQEFKSINQLNLSRFSGPDEQLIEKAFEDKLVRSKGK